MAMDTKKLGYFVLGVLAATALFALAHPTGALAQQGSVSIRRADMTKASVNNVPALGNAFAMSCVSEEGHEQCFVAFR